MEHSNAESTPSFSQQGYLVADSLYYTSRALFILFIAVIFYQLIGTLAAFADVETDFFKFWLPYTTILVSLVIIWYFIRARKFYRNLKEWNESYFQQSYMLIFDTTLPKGDSTAEKILIMSTLIFPELRSDYLNYSPYVTDNIKYFFRRKLGKSHLISKRLNFSIGSYLLDVVIKTDKGYFIIKDFRDTIVTLQDLDYLTKTLSERFKNKFRRTHVYRIICVAKTYDPSLLNREKLELLMRNELKSRFPIDLIVEEEIGYSVLWIS